VIAVNVLKAAATVRLAHSGMEEEYTTAQIQQASAEVKAVAHQRKRAGITPATNYEQDDEAAASELMKLLEDDTETLTDYTLDEETSPRPKKSERRKPSSRSSERSARSKAHQSAAGADAPRPTDGSATPSDSPDKPSRSSRRRRKRKPKQSASQTEQQAQDKPTAQTTQSVDDAGKTQPDQQASSSRSKKRRRKRKPKSKPTEEG
jgi:hypothetical protein